MIRNVTTIAVVLPVAVVTLVAKVSKMFLFASGVYFFILKVVYKGYHNVVLYTLP
jgi:hypothetical protein